MALTSPDCFDNYNPFMPVAAKPDYFGDISVTIISNSWKIFERELFIKTLSSTILQIVCKLMLHSKVNENSRQHLSRRSSGMHGFISL